MADDAQQNNQPRMSIRETQYGGDRVRLEAFFNHDGITIANIDMDCMSEEAGIELVRGLFNALRQHRSGVILTAPGTKVG